MPTTTKPATTNDQYMVSFQEWREKTLTLLLRIAFFFNITQFIAFIFASQINNRSDWIIFSSVVLLALVIISFGTHIRYHVRVHTLIFLLCSNAIVWFISRGLMGTGRIFFLTMVIWASLFLNYRASIIVLIGSILISSAIFGSFLLQILPLPTFTEAEMPYMLVTNWIGQIIASGILGGAVILCVHRLQESLQAEEATRKELQLLNEKLESQVLERTHLLEIRERSIATLLSNLPGLVYRCQNDMRWTMDFLSEGCVALTGYEPSNFINNNQIAFADIIHPDDREQVHASVQAAVQNACPFQLHYRIICANGQEKWVWEQGQGIFDDQGHLIHLEGFITDITEQKRTEEQLRFRSHLLDMVGQAVIACRLDGTVVYWNSAAEIMHGWLVSEVIGQKIADILVNPDDSQVLFEEMMTALYAGNPWSGELLTRHRNGRILPVFVTNTPYYDEQGELSGIVGILSDITERKQLEQTLRESEAKYRLLTNAMVDVVWTMNYEWQFTYVSPSVYQLRGYTPEEVLQQTMAEALCPESLQVVTEEIKLFLQSGNKHLVERLDLEQPCKDGSTVWTECITSPMKDDDGNIIGLIGVSRDITERRKLEQKIRKMNAELEQRVIERTAQLQAANDVLQLMNDRLSYYEYLVEGVSDAIISIDMDLLIRSWNYGAEKLYGWTREEVFGKKLQDVLQTEYSEGITAFTQYIFDHGFWTDEVTQRCKDGRRIPVLLTVSAFRDYKGVLMGFVGINHDMSERKKMEQALRESESRFRTLVESAPIAIAIQKMQKNGSLSLSFPFVNRAAEDICGYTLQELHTLNPWQIVHPESLELVKMQMERLLTYQETSVRFEIQIIHKDGSTRWLDVINKVIEYEGQQASLVIAADRTLYKQMEAMLVEKERFDTMRWMTSIVAHEVNTPLQVILGSLEWVPLVSKEQQDTFLGMAKEEIQRIGTILHQLMETYQPSTEICTLFNIASLIDRVLLLMSGRLAKLHIQVKRNIPANLQFVKGIQSELTQVLINLVVNAIESMPSGGTLSITIKQKNYRQKRSISPPKDRESSEPSSPLRKREQRVADTLVASDAKTVAYTTIIEIRDTGTGIDPSIQSRVFEPFFTTKQTGTGLGLFVSKRIIEYHGGTIIVKSRVNKGSVFTISLPICACTK